MPSSSHPFKLYISLLIAMYTSFRYNPYLLMGYCILDSICFQINIDMLIHHILVILLNLIYLMSSYEFVHTHHYIIPYLQRFERSTIFLTGSHFITHPQLKLLNYIVFALSFFKYRIYDSLSIIRNPTMDIKPWICCLSMFLLNLYWFVLIVKKFCKKWFLPQITCPSLHSFMIQEYLILYINCAYGWGLFWFYVSSPFLTEDITLLPSMISFYLLNISSNLFHFENVKLLEREPHFKLPENSFYFYDLLCIYLHSFQLAIRNVHHRSLQCLLLLFHVISFLYYRSYPSNIRFIEITHQTNTSVSNFIKKLPIMLDLGIIILTHSKPVDCFLFIYLKLLVHFMKPFYHLNHLATIILCMIFQISLLATSSTADPLITL